MSRQARIEEIEDSDPEEIDISTIGALDLPIPTNTFHPKQPSKASTPSSSRRTTHNPSILENPSAIPTTSKTQFISAQAQDYKHYQCLYPVYFDITRSRAQGRRVSKALAVENPLAREMADACGSLGLKAVFEPGKSHPRDWGNPGRVKVLLKLDGKPCHRVLTNSFLLRRAVGEHLRQHPTTPETPLKFRIPGVPLPSDGKSGSGHPQPPAVPRGWKIGSILPLHSPALGGPGVADDIFKEVMEGMGMGMGMGGGGGGGDGSPGVSNGGSAGEIEGRKEKRDKKKKR